MNKLVAMAMACAGLALFGPSLPAQAANYTGGLGLGCGAYGCPYGSNNGSYSPYGSSYGSYTQPYYGNGSVPGAGSYYNGSYTVGNPLRQRGCPTVVPSSGYGVPAYGTPSSGYYLPNSGYGAPSYGVPSYNVPSSGYGVPGYGGYTPSTGIGYWQ